MSESRNSSRRGGGKATTSDGGGGGTGTAAASSLTPTQRRRTPMMVYSMGLDDPYANKAADKDADDDDHDSEDSDDETNIVDPGEPMNLTAAGLILSDLDDEYPRYRLRNLQVDMTKLKQGAKMNATNVAAFRRTFAPSFGAFVAALQSYYRIKSLTLVHGNFTPTTTSGGAAGATYGGVGGPVGNGFIDLSTLQAKDNDLQALFELVLSNHLSLQQLTISHSILATKYWKIFTKHFLRESPDFHFVKLALHHTPLSSEHCQLLQQMLMRKVRLFELDVTNCGLTAADWHVVAVGVQANTHLHTLTLQETHKIASSSRTTIVIGPTTLLPLLQKPSSVARLDVRVSSSSSSTAAAPSAWEDGALESFVQELRGNDTLRHVTIPDDPIMMTESHPVVVAMEELLTTGNVAIETFEVATLANPAQVRDVPRIQQLLMDRNNKATEGSTTRGTKRGHDELLRSE